MDDAWNQVRSAKSRHEQLTKEAQETSQECVKNHGKKHVAECPECYDKLIVTLRDRYLDSPDQEWFADRKAFLRELEGMFADARDYRLDPRKVDVRIQEEMHKWIGEKLQAVASRTADPRAKAAIQDSINRSAPSSEDLRSAVDLVASTGVPEQDVQPYLERLSSVAQDPQSRADAYKDIFLLEDKDKVMPAARLKYLDMIKNGKTMGQVMGQARTDMVTAARAAQEQRKEIEAKLDGLRRARALHDADRLRKAKELEEKARMSKIPEALYNLPTCLVCNKETDSTGTGFLCCTVCQLFAGWKIQEPTVYCSQACFKDRARGQKAHSKTHTCTAGRDCVSLDERSDTKQAARFLVFCSECVDLLQVGTVYCSLPCYERHKQRHHQDVHVPWREKMGCSHDEHGEPVYTDEDKLKYNARRPAEAQAWGWREGKKYFEVSQGGGGGGGGGGVRSWYKAVEEWEAAFKVDFRPI